MQPSVLCLALVQNIVNMKAFWSVLIFSISIVCSAQQSFYSAIQLGDYGVGYSFDIIYNEKQQYQQHGYSGAAPLFVQIWHPIRAEIKDTYLTHGDFRKRVIHKDLKEVYDTLSHQMDLSFIDYNLTYDIKTGDSIDYTPATYAQVLNVLKSTRTATLLQPHAVKNNFPVIVYHHGAQGLSDENYVMAEYFASRGYIFIAANYHLPFNGLPYGYTTGAVNPQSFVYRTLEYARTISSNPNVYFIGHSWGAQMGLLTVAQDGLVQGFVSLETTLEYKTDTNKIKEFWPELFDVIATKQTKYPMPLLFFANTMEDKPFSIFQHAGAKQTYFVSEKEEFTHESYTSSLLMRALYQQQFPQSDSLIMQRQLILYNEHLKLIEAFFGEIESGIQLDKTPFLTNFYINSEK